MKINTLSLFLSLFTVCVVGERVEAKSLQAPAPLQAPVSEYWVIKAPVGSCGCAPGDKCVCGPSCTCYNGKVKPKPKPIVVRPRQVKPKPKPIVVRPRQVQPAIYMCPTISAPTYAPMMGGNWMGNCGGGGFGGGGGGCGGGG